MEHFLLNIEILCGPEDQQCFLKYLCHNICVTDIIIKHHYSGKWVILSEIKAFAEGFCLLEEYQSAIMKSSLQTDTYTTESGKAIRNEIINVQSSSIRLQTRYCLFPWLDAAVRVCDICAFNEGKMQVTRVHSAYVTVMGIFVKQ